MAKTIHVVGIGGTGMRCLESFVHLCAIGMFDETEVHMLALDTDKANGNFSRLEELVSKYNAVKGNDVAADKDTLFSAKINYYKFSPDYESNNCSFNTVIDKMATSSRRLGEQVQIKESDLVNLIISPSVGNMPLKEGYRAQTQMGSMLMYYAIIEEALNSKYSDRKGGLKSFVSTLADGAAGKQIFVFGSVFGGTGASTIPVLPKALNDAAKIIISEDREIIKGNYFGSVVLTNYFCFEPESSPDNVVIAKSDKFALNSQAALSFYRNDNTVRQSYKRLYLLGREKMHEVPCGGPGGSRQENPCDYIELMAAFAAYDFFKQCDLAPSDSSIFPEEDKVNMVYRQLSKGETLEFRNFTDEEEKFKEKLAIMTAASFFSSGYDFFENLRKDCFEFDEHDLDALRIYFKRFGLYFEAEKGSRVKGWLDQINESAEKCGFSGGAFFKKNMYACENEKDFKKYKINEEFFNGESPETFKVGMLTNKFDVVKKKIITVKPELNHSLSNLLKRTYLTFLSLYFKK